MFPPQQEPMTTPDLARKVIRRTSAAVSHALWRTSPDCSGASSSKSPWQAKWMWSADGIMRRTESRLARRSARQSSVRSARVSSSESVCNSSAKGFPPAACTKVFRTPMPRAFGCRFFRIPDGCHERSPAARALHRARLAPPPTRPGRRRQSVRSGLFYVLPLSASSRWRSCCVRESPACITA